MAFQQSTIVRPNQQLTRSPQPSTSQLPTAPIEQSQEWILFAPSQVETSTNATSRTAGLSRVSDLGSLPTGVRSGALESSVLDDVTEDDLDSLDDGLHAFREPLTYQNTSNVPVLPTHDGLGTFPASAVFEQLWQHEQHNPKRKHEGLHRRASSIHRSLNTVEELEAQASEEKRIRIEKWRMEQSRAFLEEVEKETRRQMRRERMHKQAPEDLLSSTPKQGDLSEDSEPFWRKITRKFIRDVIGIDEPLLSVILGESLPGEATPRPSSPEPSQRKSDETETSWRDRLLERIARELGVFVHQISPHPGAFATYSTSAPDYAGIPIRPQISRHNSTQSTPALASTLTPNFPPTIQDKAHAENWGFEDDPAGSSLNLKKEREYWERELDVKMVFRFLKDRFVSTAEEQEPSKLSHNDASATRAAIIRQHHPLIARSHRSPVRIRRDSRIVPRRPGSSCASEGVKSGRKASRSSSRNYWDLGGSVGSGSLIASGGLMGAWGEA